MVILFGEIVLQAQTFTPPVLPGEIPTQVVHTEVTKQDAFVMGLRISSEFDDNAWNDNRNKQSNLLTVLEPHVGWTLFGSQMKWMVDYHPGFSIGRPLSIYDSRSQLLDTSLQVTLTKRMRARLHESLLQTKSVFDRLQESESTPGSSVLDRPNDSILTAARESSEQGGGDLTYALTSHTVVGASGAFYRVSYNSAINGRELGNASSIGAHAFYSHHLTRHNWMGLDYSAQTLVSRQPESRALVQSLLYTDTLLLRPDMSFSFYAGPQRLLTRGEPAFPEDIQARQHPTWNWAGGANYIWSRTHTSLAVGVSRRISDGAGLQSIVQLSGANAEVRRQLARRWNSRLLVSGNCNKPLASGFAPLSYVSVAGGLARLLGQGLSLEFQYWRVHETSSGAQPGANLADHNRISMSLTYDLTGPLHR